MSFSDYHDDEALARKLQEEEDRQYESYMQECELRKQIQEGSVIDLCSSSSDNEEQVQEQQQPNSKEENEMSSFWYALQLQQEEEQEQAQRDLQVAQSLVHKKGVDKSILDEEIPDIHSLFVYFNETYFNNQLSMVEVKWSTKMTRWYECKMLLLYVIILG